MKTSPLRIELIKILANMADEPSTTFEQLEKFIMDFAIKFPQINSEPMSKEKLVDDYVPFGAEWEKEIMTMTKKDIIDFLRSALKEKKALETLIKSIQL